MSIASEIARINGNISAAYTTCSSMRATMPQTQNSANLANTIGTIPIGRSQPALNAPTISRTDNTINITNPSTNGTFVTGYKIFDGDNQIGTTTASSFSLSVLNAGAHALSVKACGTDFEDSAKSNVINVPIYTITRNLTNLTASNNYQVIADGLPYKVRLAPASGYYLPDNITVNIGGSASSDFSYSSATGIISIPNVNGNVIITAVGANQPSAIIPIFGVSGLYDSNPALTRTDDAIGMDFVINSSTGAIDSDFNDMFPWNETEIVNDVAGKFVSFPEMYFRIGVDSSGRMTDAAVSKSPSDEGTWYKVDPFMYSCYGASTNANKMRSVSGVTREKNKTRAEFRTFAFNNGDGYIPIDLYHRNVLMLLWWIEFATKKSDTIMSGRTSYSGTSSGESVRPTGGTDSLSTPSGFETAYTQMRYHYIEDFVGNMYDTIDGIYMNNPTYNDYVTADPANFGETTDGKTALPFANPQGNEIVAYGWDANNPFLFMPIETISNGRYDTYFCDLGIHSGSAPIAIMGSCYIDYRTPGNHGLSCVRAGGAQYSYSYYGSRLVKISLGTSPD